MSATTTLILVVLGGFVPMVGWVLWQLVKDRSVRYKHLV